MFNIFGRRTKEIRDEIDNMNGMVRWLGANQFGKSLNKLEDYAFEITNYKTHGTDQETVDGILCNQLRAVLRVKGMADPFDMLRLGRISEDIKRRLVDAGYNPTAFQSVLDSHRL